MERKLVLFFVGSRPRSRGQMLTTMLLLCLQAGTRRRSYGVANFYCADLIHGGYLM